MSAALNEQKISAEITKMLAETGKINTERQWHPVAVGAALFAAACAFVTALGAIITLIVKWGGAMIAAISDKDAATMCATAALQGLTLYRTDPADGPVVYFLERFNLVRQQSAQDLAELLSPRESVR